MILATFISSGSALTASAVPRSARIAADRGLVSPDSRDKVLRRRAEVNVRKALWMVLAVAVMPCAIAQSQEAPLAQSYRVPRLICAGTITLTVKPDGHVTTREGKRNLYRVKGANCFDAIVGEGMSDGQNFNFWFTIGGSGATGTIDLSTMTGTIGSTEVQAYVSGRLWCPAAPSCNPPHD